MALMADLNWALIPEFTHIPQCLPLSKNQISAEPIKRKRDLNEIPLKA